MASIREDIDALVSQLDSQAISPIPRDVLNSQAIVAMAAALAEMDYRIGLLESDTTGGESGTSTRPSQATGSVRKGK